MSFALTVLENVVRIAEEKRARTVTKIRLEIGELLLINPEQLEFCFRAISRETVAEDAELDISVVKAKVTCSNCGKEKPTPYGLCECGGRMVVRGGKEIVLKSIVMEVDDAQG